MRDRLGAAALVFGAGSVAVVVVVRQLELLRKNGSAAVLELLDRVGPVRPSQPGTPDVVEPLGTFALTDQSALAR